MKFPTSDDKTLYINCMGLEKYDFSIIIEKALTYFNITDPSMLTITSEYIQIDSIGGYPNMDHANFIVFELKK